MRSQRILAPVATSLSTATRSCRDFLKHRLPFELDDGQSIHSRLSFRDAAHLFSDNIPCNLLEVGPLRLYVPSVR